MPPSSDPHVFSVWDWTAVSFTLGVSVFIGLYIWFNRRSSIGNNQAGDNLLTGDRNMKPLSVSISMLVTYFSAIAVIGYPAEIFAHGIQIFFMNMILSVICIPASVVIFVIVFHKLKLTSVYEYLHLRYKSPVVRTMASLIFILETSIITGVALYVPSIPLQKLLGWSTVTSIIVIGLCGTLYTSLGGLHAVVLTDCFQFILIVLGLVAIIWRGMHISGGFYSALEIAHENGRLNFFDLNVDIFQNYNTLNILMGYGISMIWFYGAHQPNLQRYSSLPSLSAAIKGMFLNMFFQEVASILIILSGIVIVSVYVGCDPILTKKIERSDQIVPLFVQEELWFIPGMMGIFVSCILSAALSTISSSLNSLAAVAWEDFISNIKQFRQMTRIAREWTMIALSFIFGFVIMFVAYLASTTASIFQTSIIVMGSTSGTMGGAFILGLFVPISNYLGVAVGMMVGLFSMTYLSAQNFMMNLPRLSLPTSLDGCDLIHQQNATEGINFTTIGLPEIEYPEKLYTLSVVLYPVLAALITCICGTIVSIIGSTFLNKEYLWDEEDEDKYKYMHPVVPMGRDFFYKLLNGTNPSSLRLNTGGNVEIQLVEMDGNDPN